MAIVNGVNIFYPPNRLIDFVLLGNRYNAFNLGK